MYHRRLIDSHLKQWSVTANHKPLILRGARQVGKSSSVRQLAAGFEHFVEVNFEESTVPKSFFSLDFNPERIVEQLSVYFKKPIVPGRTLLFFDEIQACPAAISSLRFFYEKMPALHLIAAGSLLEFALESLPSYGVGRVRSLFVYPFSFDEFLWAMGEEQLLQAKQNAGLKAPLPDPFHQKLLGLLKIFMLTGGMPEAVATYAASAKMLEVQPVLDDLYIALKADFTKYKSTVPHTRLVEVFESVVTQAGRKFMFKSASANSNSGQIREALELLTMAGLVVPVTHSAANGLPLGAEIDHKRRKMMLFDTGIFQRIIGLDLSDFLFDPDAAIINKGAIAEQFWGLEYLKYSPPFSPPALYHWHREQPNANAEVDYVIQQGAELVPVEVKASGKGSMQSLRQFLKDKHKPFGYRFSLENFSEYEDIKSYPLYAVANLMK